MKSIATLVLAGAFVSVAGGAYALTPSRTVHRTAHLHHAAHQPDARKAQPAPEEFAPGPKVIPDPEIYQQVQ